MCYENYVQNLHKENKPHVDNTLEDLILEGLLIHEQNSTKDTTTFKTLSSWPLYPWSGSRQLNNNTEAKQSELTNLPSDTGLVWWSEWRHVTCKADLLTLTIYPFIPHTSWASESGKITQLTQFHKLISLLWVTGNFVLWSERWNSDSDFYSS